MANFAYGDLSLALHQTFEGCGLTAYADQGGVWTIGYGHTGPESACGLDRDSGSGRCVFWRAMLPGWWLALTGW